MTATESPDDSIKPVCESPATDSRQISKSTLRGLDAVNFLLADVQTGVGPFLAIYLAEQHWNEQRVGLAMTVSGLAGIATQTPVGALVDRLRSKRSIIVVGLAGLAIGAVLIALAPFLWPVLIAQTIIGGVSSVFIPAVAAISMGIVGHRAFDARQGRNQTFNSAGNVAAALAMGAIGYFSNRGIFFFVVAMTVPTLFALSFINPNDIDYNLARGCKAGDDHASSDAKGAGVVSLLRDRRIFVFLACCVMFHFANAAMLPLLGEMLSRGKGASSMMFMGVCVITTQLVITCIASPAGRLATSIGRRRLLLVAFAVLPLRGVLYTLTDRETLLVAIQILDGIGAGIFGVVSVLVIADLTRGTGRFNLTQGAIATATGIGASLSQLIAGTIVHHAGYNAGFLFLAAIAALAFGLLMVAMPETRNAENGRAAKE